MKRVARKPAKNFSSAKVPQLDFYQKVRIIAKEKRFPTPFFQRQWAPRVASQQVWLDVLSELFRNRAGGPNA
jgi:hypothetical protein